MYLFSGGLVAAALAIQAGYAWGSPYINPEIKVIFFSNDMTLLFICNNAHTLLILSLVGGF